MFKLEEFVADQLSNDEFSTDEEMLNWFMEEGPMPKEQAEFYLAQRGRFLTNPLAELEPYSLKEA